MDFISWEWKKQSKIKTATLDCSFLLGHSWMTRGLNGYRPLCISSGLFWNCVCKSRGDKRWQKQSLDKSCEKVCTSETLSNSLSCAIHYLELYPLTGGVGNHRGHETVEGHVHSLGPSPKISSCKIFVETGKKTPFHPPVASIYFWEAFKTWQNILDGTPSRCLEPPIFFHLYISQLCR